MWLNFPLAVTSSLIQAAARLRLGDGFNAARPFCWRKVLMSEKSCCSLPSMACVLVEQFVSACAVDQLTALIAIASVAARKTPRATAGRTRRTMLLPNPVKGFEHPTHGQSQGETAGMRSR